MTDQHEEPSHKGRGQGEGVGDMVSRTDEGPLTPNPSPPGRGGNAGEAASLACWASTLRDALAGILAEDDVDIAAGAEPGVLEVSTDEWSLRVEGLSDASGTDPSELTEQGPAPGRIIAWLAVDDEPDDPARYPAARRALMSPALDRALSAADAALDGALRSALIAGGDPFSQDLVKALPSQG